MSADERARLARRWDQVNKALGAGRPEMPDKETIRRWKGEKEAFRDQYARAREAADAVLGGELGGVSGAGNALDDLAAGRAGRGLTTPRHRS